MKKFNLSQWLPTDPKYTIISVNVEGNIDFPDNIR